MDVYKKLFQKALKAGKERNYPEAITLLTCITSETDSFPEAFLYLGRSYHALGRYEQAIQFLHYFIRSKPQVSAGYFFIGRSYLALGLSRYAIKPLKQAVALHPESIQGFTFLGIAYLKLRRPDLAVASLERAVELDTENKKLYNGYLNALYLQAVRLFEQEDFDMAKQIFEFLLTTGEHQGLLPNLYLAIIERESANYEKALSYYETALTFSPEDPAIRFQHALMLFQVGRGEEAADAIQSLSGIIPGVENFSWEVAVTNRILAVQYYTDKDYRKALHFAIRVLRQDNSDIDMHLLAGESYRETGDLEKSFNHFQRAFEKDRDLLEPRYGKVTILWVKKEWELLFSELEAIQRIDPRDKVAGYYIALIGEKIGLQPEECIALLQGQIRSSGPDPFLMTGLGREYIRADRADLAGKWFLKSINMNPRYEDAYLGLIDVENLIGTHRKQEKALHDYLKFFPHNEKYRRKYIQLLYNNKKYEQAVKEIEQFIPFGRKDRGIKRLLAICHRRTARFREASVLYRQLLLDEPDNEIFLRSLVYCLEKDQRIDTALTLLDRARGYMRCSADLILIHGVMQYKTGKLEAALASFREVLDKSQHDWRAYRNIGLIYEQKGVTEMADRYLRLAEKQRND
ncbi:MAG: tetratricopeptide repeat protein [Spirochaetales bacterium]|nr:tetratricopeptide repeat protein [Spirochaetales bacterium]